MVGWIPKGGGVCIRLENTNVVVATLYIKYW